MGGIITVAARWRKTAGAPRNAAGDRCADSRDVTAASVFIPFIGGSCIRCRAGQSR
jgi:hypothetical protein